VLFLDEAEALSLEHLLTPPAAREASARLVAALCEKLDGLAPPGRVLVVGSTSRTDAIDAELVAPGRLDHLVEIALARRRRPARDPGLMKRGPSATPAGRCSRSSTTGRSCPSWAHERADMSEIIRRALEAKVHRAAEGAEPGSVSTEDLLLSIDAYKRVRGVVEKIRYGQYL